VSQLARNLERPLTSYGLGGPIAVSNGGGLIFMTNRPAGSAMRAAIMSTLVHIPFGIVFEMIASSSRVERVGGTSSE